MSASSLPTIALLLSFAIYFIEASGDGGFTIDLIHRDSPQSPFYNPSHTLSDRVLGAILRSNSRLDYFRSTSSSITPTAISSTVIPNKGEYLMTLSIGTPPVEILAIADTGSDLIWIQCKPCNTCYKQKAPLFDPNTSSTYQNLLCNSNPCKALPRSSCNSDNSCEYSYSYADHSHTQGLLAMETLTFDSSIKIPNVAFGCGHDNNGTFDSNGAGLVGLGDGFLSLISQLGSSIQGKFSYCLVPTDKTTSSSRMDFGEKAVVSGKGTVSTPITKKNPATFYYLTLETISVGDKSVTMGLDIIIDSGTTLTFLPRTVYNNIVTALKEAIKLPPSNDPFLMLELCYEASDDVKVPNLTFEFEGGAKLVLGSLNTFIRVSDDMVCLAMRPSDSFSIFGNVAQQNFKVGYDVVGMKVSFQPTDCTIN